MTLPVEGLKNIMINQPGQNISTPLEQGIKQTGNGGHPDHKNDTGLVSKQRDERDDAGYQDGRLE